MLAIKSAAQWKLPQARECTVLFSVCIVVLLPQLLLHLGQLALQILDLGFVGLGTQPLLISLSSRLVKWVKNDG